MNFTERDPKFSTDALHKPLYVQVSLLSHTHHGNTQPTTRAKLKLPAADFFVETKQVPGGKKKRFALNALKK